MPNLHEGVRHITVGNMLQNRIDAVTGIKNLQRSHNDASV